MPRRCMFGCTRTNGVLHIFPNPAKFPEQFEAWIKVATEITGCDIDIKTKRICDRHFTEQDRNRNNRLNALAVPSLFLHGNREITTPPSAAGTPAPLGVFDKSAVNPLQDIEDANPKSPIISGPQDPGPPPVTFYDESIETPEYLDETESVLDDFSMCASPAAFEFVSATEPTPSQPLQTAVVGGIVNNSNNKSSVITDDFELNDTDKTPHTNNNQETVKSTLNVQKPCLECLRRKEHNYCRDPINQMSNAQSVQIESLNDKLNNIRRALKTARSQLNKLQRHNRIMKEKMAEMRRDYSKNILEKVTKRMTPAARVFTKMQYTQTHRQRKGRRFSPDEKVLAISMYKSSATGYAVLSNFFTLPSVKSIRKCLLDVQKEIDDYNNVTNVNNLPEDDEDMQLSENITEELQESHVVFTDNINEELPERRVILPENVPEVPQIGRAGRKYVKARKVIRVVREDSSQSNNETIDDYQQTLDMALPENITEVPQIARTGRKYVKARKVIRVVREDSSQINNETIDDYQQTLDMALSGLSYDMPIL